ncbi:hypothetical protein J1614_000259 [Plenodomus biglobosus]|nr:hypothetical protein J1614_000259 [Plenodomus biglobosus]
MNYIHRFLDRYSAGRPQRDSHVASSPEKTRCSSPPGRIFDCRPLRSHRHIHHSKMTFFDGPWSMDLESFKKSVQSTPDQYKSSITSASTVTLEKICDPDVLHVWETDSDVDNLLQLTSVIAKLCDLGVRKEKGAQSQDGNMLILVEEKQSRNNYARICQLVEYLTGANGKKRLEGTVVAFGKIVIVRGWDNTILSGQQEALDRTIERVNTALERVLQLGNFVGNKKKIVWHHGPVLHFLLSWLTGTTPTLRSCLAGITITEAFDLTNSITRSRVGHTNTLPALECLERFANKLSIPVVFLDASSQSITGDYLATYMYFHAYYIHTFLPSSLSRPHLHKAQDELVTFAFRLRAASEGRYGSDVVYQVQKHLDASTARHWALDCINKESYTKDRCRAAGREEAIHHAVNLADTPFARFNFPRSSSITKSGIGKGIPAFARLAIGPASRSSHTHSLAVPVSISFKTRKIRPSNPSCLHILIPLPGQDTEKVSARVQGLMMAVLERVRQEHGNPVLSKKERDMWKDVVKACAWALEGCGHKCPSGVEEKMVYVRGKLKEGTWGSALFPEKKGGAAASANSNAHTTTDLVGAGVVTGAATAQPMQEPVRSYGFNQGTQQTTGAYGFTPTSGLTQQHSAGLPVQVQTWVPPHMQGLAQTGGVGVNTAMYPGYNLPQPQPPQPQPQTFQTAQPTLSPPFAHQSLQQQQQQHGPRQQYTSTGFTPQGPLAAPAPYQQSMGGAW